MVINFTIFFIFSFAFVFSIISTNWFVLLDQAYGHGLSRDESLPFEISGKQIAIEGILDPPFLNEGNQKPTFMVRTHDENTNETIKDINYRIIAKFKNETLMDQRFHALDGIISANLVPSNNSILHELILKNHEQQNLSKNDLVEVSLKNPIIIKSKLLTDGGLYDITVILEKTSIGLKLDSDKKVDLFISIGKTIPFVITESSNDSRNNNNNGNGNGNGNLTLTVKTFYDEITDFLYNQQN